MQDGEVIEAVRFAQPVHVDGSRTETYFARSGGWSFEFFGDAVRLTNESGRVVEVYGCGHTRYVVKPAPAASAAVAPSPLPTKIAVAQGKRKS